MRLGRVSLALAMALSCFLFVVGCATQDYTPKLQAATLKEPTIGEADTLRVGVNTAKRPLAGMGTDKIIGLDVDIAAALADNLGLELSIVDVGSDPTGALSSNKVDIVMGLEAGQTLDNVWLSDEYLPQGLGIFALGDDAPLPTTSLNPRFAAQSASASATAVIEQFGNNALTQTQTLADAFADLEAGSVNYVAADVIIGTYAAFSADVDATVIGLIGPANGYVIGVAKSNSILCDAIDDEINTLLKDGIIDLIQKKWLGEVISLDGIPEIALKTPTPEETAPTGEAGAGAVGADGTTLTDGTDNANSTTGAGANGTGGATTGTGTGSTGTNNGTGTSGTGTGGQTQ